MSRHELTDQQWKIIEPLLPKRKSKVGRPPIHPRQVLNGIIYVLRTGCAWADLPRKYGSPTTCWRRLRDWQKLGIWERIWRKLLQLLDEQEKLDLSQVYLDGSFVAAKQGGNEIGITKIGKGSKIMLIVERNGLPIGLNVTSAQPHELKLAEKVLSTIRIPSKRGRPKKRIFELITAKNSVAFSESVESK